jgi:hypothetical protein
MGPEPLSWTAGGSHHAVSLVPRTGCAAFHFLLFAALRAPSEKVNTPHAAGPLDITTPTVPYRRAAGTHPAALSGARTSPLEIGGEAASRFTARQRPCVGQSTKPLCGRETRTSATAALQMHARSRWPPAQPSARRAAPGRETADDPNSLLAQSFLGRADAVTESMSYGVDRNRAGCKRGCTTRCYPFLPTHACADPLRTTPPPPSDPAAADHAAATRPSAESRGPPPQLGRGPAPARSAGAGHRARRPTADGRPRRVPGGQAAASGRDTAPRLGARNPPPAAARPGRHHLHPPPPARTQVLRGRSKSHPLNPTS